MTFEVTIDGDPMAAPRPRVRQIKTKDGRQFAGAYNPTFYTKYKAAAQYMVTMAAREQLPAGLLWTTAAVVEVDVYVPMPSSLSAKKRELAECGLLRPITRPDVDNYLKTALDLLNGIVLSDDSIVVSATVHKQYASKPRMRIKIAEPLTVPVIADTEQGQKKLL